MTDFPTQSEPVSGLERGAIQLSDRALRETVLPPWRAAITKNGALGVMAGYPEIEDIPAHGSEKWMSGVLRQELGLEGIVVSEGEGFGTLIYEGIVPTQKEAGVMALRAGVDMNITYEPAYMGPLIESVQDASIPIALVDRRPQCARAGLEGQAHSVSQPRSEQFLAGAVRMVSKDGGAPAVLLAADVAR